ncbi:MAG: hypothetical protein IZT58_09960 [Actinobacteria bacterium]|nr:hypothetical protein [Actinomycetota bacterium]
MEVELQDHEKGADVPEERPPLFSSWNTWYTVVFLNLVFLIVLFWTFTRVFR